jgi:hypothetical protein
MREVRVVRPFAFFSVVMTCLLCAPAALVAQAWLPSKGDGSVSFGVQTTSVQGHFDSDGTKLPVAKSRAINLLFGLSYSFTDRFTADVSLPLVITKFTGDQNDLKFHFHSVVPAHLDDGSSHSTFQDFHIDLRYNVLRDSKRRGLSDVAVTPFFSFIVPSHSYAYHGESAFGRYLREYVLGISVGRLLSPVLRRAYAQGQYSYAFVQKANEANDISLNHSNVDIELGYFLPHSLSVFGFGSWLHTYGGLSIAEVMANPQLIPIHDRLLGANYWHLGTGANYSLTRSVDLSFSYVTYLSGANTHYGRVVTVGTFWNFSTRHLNTFPESGRTSPGSSLDVLSPMKLGGLQP